MPQGVSDAPPERIELDDGNYVRWLGVDDADDVARAVGESIDSLKPWMPWADAQSADAEFQRGDYTVHWLEQFVTS
jgi:hypothetical protein